MGRGNGTPLWSDVVPDPPGPEPDPPAPRIQELMDAGVPRPVAEAVATCEAALIVAGISADGLAVVAAHAALVLVHPAVVDAVRRHSCGPETADGWRALAACVPEPVRSTCHQLADAAARRC